MSALRYDEATSKLELLTVGQSLKSIIHAYSDIHECIRAARDIRDVLLDTGQFFRSMHEVFSKCRVEKHTKGLNVLIQVLIDSMKCMDGKQTNIYMKSLLSDVIGCLSNPEVRDSSEALLENIVKSDSPISSSLTMEIEHMLLNSRDSTVLEAVKSVSAKLLGSSFSGFVPKRDLAPAASSREASAGLISQSRNMASSSVSAVSRGGGVMKLSFLPHSITEQWLLASGADELRLVLEEITAVYNSLQPQVRVACRADMPKMLKHVLVNCSTDEPLVIVNGLQLFAAVARHCIEAFLDDVFLLDALFPKLQVYMHHLSDNVRIGAFRLAVSLVAKLPFQLVDSFILNISEENTKYSENILKLAALGLLTLSKEHMAEESSSFAAIKIRVGRIGKAAIKHLIMTRPPSAEGEDDEDDETALKGVDKGKGGRNSAILGKTSVQFCSEVAKDVVAAALLVLCPSAADPNTGIFPDLLPANFIEKLFGLQGADDFKTIESSLQAEITLRASGLSFPSLVTDAVISSHLTAVLASRLNKEADSPSSTSVQRKAIANRNLLHVHVDALSSQENEDIGRLNQTWPQNFPTPERSLSSTRNRLFDSPMPHIAESAMAAEDGGESGMTYPKLSYVPSWTGADTEQQREQAQEQLGRSLESPWTSGESEIDRTKLSALKSARRTPGSRRAHSAEVQVQSHRDFDLDNMAPAPNTSDGQRHGVGNTSKVLRKDAAGGSDDGFSPLPTSTIGNFMTGPVEKRVSPLKLPKRKGLQKHESDESMVFETSEYTINLPVRNARDNSDDEDPDGEMYMQNRNGNARGAVKNSPRQPSDSGGAMRATIPFLKRGEGKARRDERIAAGSSLLLGDSEAQRATEREREREREWESSLQAPTVELDVLLSEHNRGLASKRAAVQHSPRQPMKAAPSETPPRRVPVGSGAVVSNKVPRAALSPRNDKEEAYQVEKLTPAKRNPRPAAAHAREQLDEDVPDKARMAPSALMPESLDYLDTSEIAPIQQPQKELPKVLKDMDTHGWPEIFHTLNKVRQLCLHHQSLIMGTSKTTLHSIYQSVLRHCDNLRSQVAKNAVLALGDMYIGFGRTMDGEVISTIFCLTKKCADSATSFLAETAEASLCRVIDHATPSRTMTGLLNCTDNRNPTLRARVAGFLQLLVSSRSAELRGCREIDTLKAKLEGMLNDNTPDARAFSRDILRVLIDQSIVSRAELEQRMPPDLVSKALSMPVNGAASPIRSKAASPRRDRAKEPLRHSQTAEFPDEADGALTMPSDDENADEDHEGVEYMRQQFEQNQFTAADEEELENSSSGMLLGGGHSGSGGKKKKGRRPAAKKAAAADPLESSNDMSGHTPSRAKASAAKRIMENNEDLLRLQDHYVALQSTLWTDRRDALTSISDLVCQHTTVLRDASKLNVVLDRLLESLEDGSVKVVLHALQCISRIHEAAPVVLSSMQHIVQPALLSVASSSNKQVSSAASLVLKDVIGSFPLQTVIQQLCQTALHDKDRLKVLAFRLLRDSISKCYSSSENAASSLSIRKLIFPTICKTVLGSKQQGEVRVAAADALKEIQRGCPMGEKVISWVDDRSHQEELQRILRS